MLQFDEEGITWTCNDLQKICQTISDTVKNNLKIQILKLLKDQKILKNQMIHCLEIIKTIEKYKKKMSYIQKNNSWLWLLKGIKRFKAYKL